MKPKLIAAVLAVASFLSAQTAQTSVFRALMTSISGNSGVTDLVLHVVKDSSGNIISGSIDFNLAYQFPNDEVVTDLGINGGAAAFSAAISPVQATAGSGRISRQVQVTASDQTGLAILTGLLANPGQYSVSVGTADQAGAMSGTVLAANSGFLMALLNSSAGTGVATVIVSYTGAADAITSGQVAIQLTYQFSAQVTFSGMRVYAGQGESWPIAVAADLMPGTLSAASGTGVLTAPATQIDMTDSQMVQAVQSMLLGGLTNFSVGVDTVENPSAPLTGQLRGTDFMTFQIPGFPGAGAASRIGLHTLRQESGSVAAGMVAFDVNYRLAAGAQIAGMDIDGNVTAPAVSTDPSGSGNAYALIGVYGGAGLASLNGIVANPAAHQLDVVTTSTMSAPLAAANPALPVVAAVIPIVEVTDLSTFAPGELVEIYGTNLSLVTTDLSGWPGVSLPSPLNGVSVVLAGHGARLLYVSPGQVDALLPFGAPTGLQELTLTNANGTSAPISLQVAAVAPALYNFAFENADFSLVSSYHPAHAGDVLVLYATGMGQTTPPLVTGQIVPSANYVTAPVTVTIGGVTANVFYSIAAPPYVAGLYQMAVTVPSGLASGSQPVVATSGGLQSNTVTIAIQ
ncbi:MAG: hypothetical protein ABSG56_31710 [Bryobacteraceae bacterium]|jgi:uncharacterized protein (TIGR03437 family)